MPTLCLKVLVCGGGKGDQELVCLKKHRSKTYFVRTFVIKNPRVYKNPSKKSSLKTDLVFVL